MELSEGMPCPMCKAPLAAMQLAETKGDEAPIRLTVRNLPVLACAAPHRYFIGKKFAIWLLNALVDEELPKIPAGKAKGLLFKKYACGSCEAPLPAAGGETLTFASSLAWNATPAFTVEVAMPMYRCAGCGKEQARSGEELAKLLPAALVHVFMAAGIKAPG